MSLPSHPKVVITGTGSGLGRALALEAVRRGGTVLGADIDEVGNAETLRQVEAAGGRVIRPKFSIGEFGWVALCQDTEGNIFGLNSLK